MIHEPTWKPVDSVISTDACLSGIGGYANGEYFHSIIPSAFLEDPDVHINELECLAVVVAVKTWCTQLNRFNLVLYCDNEATVSVINRGRARNKFTQNCLREITYLAGLHHFQLQVEHVSGANNRVSDFLSRWHLGDNYRTLFFNEVAARGDCAKLKHIMLPDNIFEFEHDW